MLEYLEEVGIFYEVDPRLVRGLDYYNRTVFEFFADGKEAEIGALGGGGRYDYLDGNDRRARDAGPGCRAGRRAFIAVMRAMEVAVPPRAAKKVFLAHAGTLAKKNAFALREELRSPASASRKRSRRNRSAPSSRWRTRKASGIALILGQKEIYEKSVIVRDLAAGTQESVLIEKIVEEIKKRLK